MAQVRARLARDQERLTELILHSPSDGIFILPRAADLPGRHLRQGEEVGYLLNATRPVVRAVVRESDMALVRHRTRNLSEKL